MLLPPLQGFPAVDVLHSFQVNSAFDVNGKIEIRFVGDECFYPHAFIILGLCFSRALNEMFFLQTLRHTSQYSCYIGLPCSYEFSFMSITSDLIIYCSVMFSHPLKHLEMQQLCLCKYDVIFFNIYTLHVKNIHLLVIV